MKSVIMKIKSTQENKTARGYRLKPETHELISKIQKILNSDQDAAIAGACARYYEELSKSRTPKKQN